jgi:hypothetical protein
LKRLLLETAAIMPPPKPKKPAASRAKRTAG